MSRADAGFRGCIRNFKINLREVKLSSASDPMVTQRSGLAKCGASPCEGIPCKNGGKCHAATGGTYFSCSCPESYSGVRCEASDEEKWSNDNNDVVSYEEEMQTHPCDSSPCQGGGTCVAAAAAFANGAQFVCRCPPGRAGRLCQDLGKQRIFFITFKRSAC